VRLKGEVADRKTAVAFDMKRDDNGTVFDGLDVVHGASDIKGRLDIRDAPKPVWTVSVTSSTLDLNELDDGAQRGRVGERRDVRLAGVEARLQRRAGVVRRVARPQRDGRRRHRSPGSAGRAQGGARRTRFLRRRREARCARGAGRGLRRHDRGFGLDRRANESPAIAVKLEDASSICPPSRRRGRQSAGEGWQDDGCRSISRCAATRRISG
jgi:hypothetical protein